MTQAVALSETQARTLTERIRKAGEDFGTLLLEAHEGRAWETLGYATWGDYVAGEFTFTRGQSYRLLATATVEKHTGEHVAGRLAEKVVARSRQVPDFTSEPSAAVQRALDEQRAEEAARRAVPKPTGKRAPIRGLDGLIASLRSTAERVEALADERTDEDALPPDLERAVTRLMRALERLT